MTIILLIFFILAFSNAKLVKYNEEYLSKDYTNIIKGVFLFFVFVSHFISYNVVLDNKYIDTIGIQFIKRMGQLMVTLFLFYSGYGIMESVKKKGENYIKSMPIKRILPTLINFDIAVLIFMFASRYFLTHNFSIKKLLLALIGWDGFGNSNWYIFCIIILYFIAFLSLKSFKDKKISLIFMVIGTILYTKIMSFYKQGYWYNTAFCFALGSAYSFYKERIEEFIKDKEFISIIYLIALFIIAYNQRSNIFWYYIYTLAFVLIVVLITRKIKIKNVILLWMGKNLFPLYIFQRLPMMLLNRVKYMNNNPYIFFATALVATIVITFIYIGAMFTISKCRDRIHKKFKNKSVEIK